MPQICPPPKKKPAGGAGSIRVAGNGVTRGAEPFWVLQEPDFTCPDTKDPFSTRAAYPER